MRQCEIGIKHFEIHSIPKNTLFSGNVAVQVNSGGSTENNKAGETVILEEVL